MRAEAIGRRNYGSLLAMSSSVRRCASSSADSARTVTSSSPSEIVVPLSGCSVRALRIGVITVVSTETDASCYRRSVRRISRAIVVVGAFGFASARADTRGEIVETDTLGMNVVSYNASAGKTTTVADAANLSEFVGLHYYIIDHVRLGANLQFTERIAPDPASGQSRFQTLALLPQVGWNFRRPFFVALVITLAPWTGGTNTFDGGFQGVFGASFEVQSRINANIAVEVPINLVRATTIGLTPLVGISVRL